MKTTTDELIAKARVRNTVPEPAVRRLLRKRARLTQAEVAAAVGVTQAAVARWEKGDRNPNARFAPVYVNLLDRIAAEVIAR